MFIVIYRPHNKLNLETQYHGPFLSHDDAYDFLCGLPALGIQDQDPEIVTPNPGVKFIQSLIAPQRVEPADTPAIAAIRAAYAHATQEFLERVESLPNGLRAARWKVALTTAEDYLEGCNRREIAEFLLGGLDPIDQITPEQCAARLFEERRDAAIEDEIDGTPTFDQGLLDEYRDQLAAFLDGFEG